jgi:CheY-like chemotaxis protein
LASRGSSFLISNAPDRDDSKESSVLGFADLGGAGASELHPDLIILDLNLPDRNHIAPFEAKRLLNGAKVLAITLGTDDLKEELLDSVGAVRLLDKAELSNELIPAILELAPAHINTEQFDCS